MTIHSHPDPSTLIAYASGTLPAALAGVVASHLTMCPQCADHVRMLNTVGGILMMHSQSEPADAQGEQASAAKAMKRAKANALPWETSEKAFAKADSLLPGPIARYLGMSAEEIPWKSLPKGIKQYWVKMPEGGGLMRLLKAPPHTQLLEHSHRGMELTMVLSGVYSDHTGDYRRGDIAEMPVDTDHMPASTGDEECLCIVASEFMPRYSRWYARLASPIIGF